MTNQQKQIHQPEELSKTDIKHIMNTAEMLSKLEDNPQALHMIKNKIENMADNKDAQTRQNGLMPPEEYKKRIIQWVEGMHDIKRIRQLYIITQSLYSKQK